MTEQSNVVRNVREVQAEKEKPMNLNPPRKVRAALYVLTSIGTPIAAYLKFKGYIGDAELALWGAEVTIVNGLAALNTAPVE